MLRRLCALPLVAALMAGCTLTDCSFETTDVAGFDTVRTEAGSLGDTLTVMFVQAYERDLRVFTRAGLEPTPSTDGEAVTVSYDAEGLEFGDVSPPHPPRLASLLQGDTMYVYVEGELSPDLFTEVCSPPTAYLRIDVLGVDAPEAVRAVRVTSAFADELPPRTAAALRQLDAGRPRPALTV
ncbi:MAG: hypothetical protein Rubg2KO_12340 [Rubricoccaceae bacterium]